VNLPDPFVARHGAQMLEHRVLNHGSSSFFFAGMESFFCASATSLKKTPPMIWRLNRGC